MFADDCKLVTTCWIAPRSARFASIAGFARATPPNVTENTTKEATRENNIVKKEQYERTGSYWIELGCTTVKCKRIVC